MKLPNIWFGWILIVGLIVISSVSATPGDICTTHSNVKLENIVMMREHALNVSTITLVPSMVTQ
jgi:hypothetical protein